MHTTSNPAAQRASLAVLFATSFAFIIVQLDVTIVNVALPRMGAELGAQVSTLQWVIDAYTLGFATFLLSAGVVGDKFGSRRVFLSGFALFTLASIACALAPSAMALNVARAVQGWARRCSCPVRWPSSMPPMPTTKTCSPKRSAGGRRPAAYRLRLAR